MKKILENICAWFKKTCKKVFLIWLPTVFTRWLPTLLKNLLSVSVITFLFIGLIITVLIYLMNNAYTTAIIRDLVDTFKKTATLNQDQLLTLERLYVLRNELANIDISKFMYTIFSAVFLTFGIIILNQVTSTHDKTKKSVELINKEIEKSKNELHKTAEDDIIHKSVQQLNTTLASVQALLLYLEINLAGTDDLDDKYIVYLLDNTMFIAECVNSIQNKSMSIELRRMVEITRKILLVCIERIDYLANTYNDKLNKSLYPMKFVLNESLNKLN
jgi:hypothetical protein